MNNRWYKWVALALLGGAYFFHQADRALFGLLTIPIQNELALSDVQIGWINTALSWTLALMALVAGPVADRCSRKWIMTISLMAWSVMTIMMGFVGEWHWGPLVLSAFVVTLLFRALATGVGESFFGPALPPYIAEYHHETRSLALSIMQASLYIGLMTSGVIVASALGVLGSWRNVFIVFGAAGFALGVVFVGGLRSEKGKVKSEEVERSERSEKGKVKGEKVGVLEGYRVFFKTPMAIRIMLGFVAIVFVNNAYLFWAPKYMSMKFGWGVEASGSATMLYHHLFAFATILAAGALSDRLVKKLPRFRILLMRGALFAGAPCLLAIGLAPTATLMIVMTAAYGVFRGCFECNTHAALYDYIAPKYRSSAGSVLIFSAFLIGGLSGVLMGALADHYGVRGFEIGFAIMGAAYLLAGAALREVKKEK